MKFRQVFRVAVCAGLFALLIAGAVLFPAQPVAGKETRSAGLNGAVALNQLKRDGQYDSMQASPLMIAPLFTSQQKLVAADGATNDRFGSSVALDGDTLVVGTSGEVGVPGSAYVFTRSDETWTLQQKLTAGDGEAGDHFGASVAIDGDTLLVGAPYDNIDARQIGRA